MRALVIIPTYNERANLVRLAPTVLHAAPVDLLIVDDSSPDGTGYLADCLTRESEGRINVLHRPAKLGLGTAYIAGFHWGMERGYEFLFEMESDFSRDPNDLPHFLAAAADADVVLGSRYIPGAVLPDWSWSRRLLGRGSSFYARRVLALPYHDLSGGYRCLRRQALESIPLDRIRANGYGFQIEMTWHCHQAGLRITEIPITFNDRAEGESKQTRRVVWDAVGLVWQLRRHRNR